MLERLFCERIRYEGSSIDAYVDGIWAHKVMDDAYVVSNADERDEAIPSDVTMPRCPMNGTNHLQILTMKLVAFCERT